MYYKVFAILDDDSIVGEFRLFDDLDSANIYAKSIYANGKAVNVNYYKLKIGDIYRKGEFYRFSKDTGEEEIIRSRIPEEERSKKYIEIIEELKNRIKYLEDIVR